MSVATNPSLVPHNDRSPNPTSVPPVRRRAKRKSPANRQADETGGRSVAKNEDSARVAHRPKVVLTDDSVGQVEAKPKRAKPKRTAKKGTAKKATAKKAPKKRDGENPEAMSAAVEKPTPKKARRKKAAAKAARPGLVQTVMAKLQMNRGRLSLAPTSRRSQLVPVRSLSQRLIAVACSIVAILFALALFSPAGGTNYAGPAGALLADLSTSFLGYSAYVLPLMGLIVAVALYRATLFVPNGRHVGGALLFGAGTMTLLQVALPLSETSTFAAGGLVGALLVSVFLPLLSTVGTYVVAAGLLVAGVMTFGDVVMQTALVRTYKGIRLRGEALLDRVDAWREEHRLLRDERDRLDAEIAAAEEAEPMGRTTRIMERALRGALEKRRGRSRRRAGFSANDDYDVEGYDDYGDAIDGYVPSTPPVAPDEDEDSVMVATPRPVVRAVAGPDAPSSSDVSVQSRDIVRSDTDSSAVLTPAPVRRARGDDPKWAAALSQREVAHSTDIDDDATPVVDVVIPKQAIAPVAVPPVVDVTPVHAAKTTPRTAARKPAAANPAAAGAAGLRIVEREDGSAPLIDDDAIEEEAEYVFPPLKLLDYDAPDRVAIDEDFMFAEADKLVSKFADFGIKGTVREVRPGPVVTTYEFVPAPGIKVSRIASLSDDIAMAMEAVHVRIVAPIPGKGAVGIEIPNERRETVFLKEIIATDKFKDDKTSKLVMALGKDIEGRPYTADLAAMPHVLISGTTGSGKSVSVNAMICSLLYRAKPEDVKFLMIDPKMLELSIYEGIPHLLLPPIIDSKKAANALQWAVAEMERRYKAMSETGVRDIAGYNDVIKSIRAGTDPMGRKVPLDEKGQPMDRFPFIVIIIDEYADLLAIAGKDVEGLVMRLAQKARAAGLHVMLATQRPSVDVITGVIKANFPVRMGFRLASSHDSKTIINRPGAEKLLGKGDMLIMPAGTSNVTRVHGAYISEKELHRVIEHLKTQGSPNYDMSIIEPPEGDDDYGDAGEQEKDAKWDQAIDIVARGRRCTTSWLQRQLAIGYNRAARIVEMMEREGLVGPTTNAKGEREIFIPPR